MPSAHASNCFAVALVLFVFYRWTVWFTLPIGVLVAFSRVYNGVHYPSDVLAGAILGAGTAAVIVWVADRVWLGVKMKRGVERESVERGADDSGFRCH